MVQKRYSTYEGNLAEGEVAAPLRQQTRFGMCQRCSQRGVVIDGRMNSCQNCNFTWCHMCRQDNFGSLNCFQKALGTICGARFQMCAVFHWCRYSIVNGARRPTPCFFYWFTAFLASFTYAAWGLLACIWVWFERVAFLTNRALCRTSQGVCCKAFLVPVWILIFLILIYCTALFCGYGYICMLFVFLIVGPCLHREIRY